MLDNWPGYLASNLECFAKFPSEVEVILEDSNKKDGYAARFNEKREAYVKQIAENMDLMRKTEILVGVPIIGTERRLPATDAKKLESRAIGSSGNVFKDGAKEDGSRTTKESSVLVDKDESNSSRTKEGDERSQDGSMSLKDRTWALIL